MTDAFSEHLDGPVKVSSLWHVRARFVYKEIGKVSIVKLHGGSNEQKHKAIIVRGSISCLCHA